MVFTSNRSMSNISMNRVILRLFPQCVTSTYRLCGRGAWILNRPVERRRLQGGPFAASLNVNTTCLQRVCAPLLVTGKL
jgi:hypothetical protein